MFQRYTFVLLLILLLHDQVLGLGSKTLCRVDGSSNLAVGHNIESEGRCGQYCDLIPGCTHWTWYSRHCPNKRTCGDEEDEFVLTNICYALSDCEEIEQKECGQNTCYSGQKKTQTSRRLSVNNDDGGQDETITQEITWNSRIMPKQEL